MDEMLDRLVYKNEASGLTYVAEIRKRAPAPGPPARLALAASPHAHVQRGRLRPSVSVAPSAWLCRALWCKRAEAGCGSQALAVCPPIAAQTALLCARWPRGAPQGVGRPARAALDKRAPTARMLPHAGAARSATRWTTWRASSRRCWRWACARARWPATRRTSSWRSPRSWARHAGRCTRRRPPVRSRAGGALRARRALPRRTGRRSRARALLRGRRGPLSALYTWYDRALTLPYRTLCRPRRPGAGVCGVPRVGHGAGRRRAAQPAAPGGAGGDVRAVARDRQAALPRLGLGHVPGVRAALQGARPAAPAAQPQRKLL